MLQLAFQRARYVCAMTIVKICGMRTAEHALAAAATRADMLGFILAPSRRQITPAEARAIGQAVRAAHGEQAPQLVGVVVNETAARIRAIAAECALDAVQLSGDEPPALAGELADMTLIKAIRFDGSAAEQGWLAESWPHVRLLVDAHTPGTYGGAGVMADWEQSAALAKQRPILLAGGLSPDNVGLAIAHVRPWGVDVSSGVETAGVKDSAKIRAFVAAARAAEREFTPFANGQSTLE